MIRTINGRMILVVQYVNRSDSGGGAYGLRRLFFVANEAFSFFAKLVHTELADRFDLQHVSRFVRIDTPG